MKARLLIVEDERGLVMTLRDRLTREGYEVETLSDGDAALARAAEQTFDLILLDLMLPGASGLDVCRELRSRGSKTPILMLTARSEITDKVVGLKIGADDYLTKPFEMAELLARIEVQLRRRASGAADRGDPPSAGVHSFGDITIDLRRAEVLREGAPLSLSAKEFHLLRYFVEHRGATLSRDELLNAVWGYESTPNTRTVDVHIAWLRRKLEPNAHHPSYILTVHGLGYKFVG